MSQGSGHQSQTIHPTKHLEIQTRCLGSAISWKEDNGQSRFYHQQSTTSMYFPIPSDLFWKHAPAGRPGGQYPVHCSFTCVPGKSSFALLIIIFVQEDLRSSAIVSPPFPIMWPETLLEKTTIMFFSFQCLNKTWVQAS